tara:strand:+ start:90 stop:989 length:900 start_codon:yes stop_codon:yes gene_type:complete
MAYTGNIYKGYTPKYKKGDVNVPYGTDNRLDNIHPFEFKKGMDYELTNLGCASIKDSKLEDREKASENVVKNLNTHPQYYTKKIQFEAGVTFGGKIDETSFKKYLDEESPQMKEVGNSFDRKKMSAPSFKDDKMVKLKEAIKNEIRTKIIAEQEHTLSTPQIENTNVCCKYPSSNKGIQKSKNGWCPRTMVAIDCSSKSPISLSEAKKDVYDIDDETEPTKSDLKGIDKSIVDAKEALAKATKKVKELAPDIKKLAKETNDKIKKNPAGKADYLKVYKSNPDVKEFIKLRRMLKDAELL